VHNPHEQLDLNIIRVKLDNSTRARSDSEMRQCLNTDAFHRAGSKRHLVNDRLECESEIEEDRELFSVDDPFGDFIGNLEGVSGVNSQIGDSRQTRDSSVVTSEGSNRMSSEVMQLYKFPSSLTNAQGAVSGDEETRDDIISERIRTLDGVKEDAALSESEEPFINILRKDCPNSRAVDDSNPKPRGRVRPTRSTRSIQCVDELEISDVCYNNTKRPKMDVQAERIQNFTPERRSEQKFPTTLRERPHSTARGFLSAAASCTVSHAPLDDESSPRKVVQTVAGACVREEDCSLSRGEVSRRNTGSRRNMFDEELDDEITPSWLTLEPQLGFAGISFSNIIVINV